MVIGRLPGLWLETLSRQNRSHWKKNTLEEKALDWIALSFLPSEKSVCRCAAGHRTFSSVGQVFPGTGPIIRPLRPLSRAALALTAGPPGALFIITNPPGPKPSTGSSSFPSINHRKSHAQSQVINEVLPRRVWPQLKAAACLSV